MDDLNNRPASTGECPFCHGTVRSDEKTCPNCGKIFPIDEANYTAIVQQIRDKEFEQSLQKQLKKEVELSKSELSQEKDKIITEKKEQHLL